MRLFYYPNNADNTSDNPNIIIGRPTTMPTIVILIIIPTTVNTIPSINESPLPTNDRKNLPILYNKRNGQVNSANNNLIIVTPQYFLSLIVSV